MNFFKKRVQGQKSDDSIDLSHSRRDKAIW